MAPTSVTKDELRERELEVVENYRLLFGNTRFENVYPLIVKDRLERWAVWVHELEISSRMRKWAAMMTSIYGPKVIMHRADPKPGYQVDWITALLIVRYGEAEYFWPGELTDEELPRARAWLNGKATPAIVTYIVPEV